MNPLEDGQFASIVAPTFELVAVNFAQNGQGGPTAMQWLVTR
jgi:hypothetical protein